MSSFDTIKYLAGSFEITDNKGFLSFKGVVEKTPQTIKPFFWVNMGVFHGNNETMAYNSIEMRALAHRLREISYDATVKYRKMSGGSSSVKKTIEATMLDQKMIITMSVKEHSFKFIVDSGEIVALADEIENLANITVNSCYTAQKSIIKNRI